MTVPGRPQPQGIKKTLHSDAVDRHLALNLPDSCVQPAHGYEQYLSALLMVHKESALLRAFQFRRTSTADQLVFLSEAGTWSRRSNSLG